MVAVRELQAYKVVLILSREEERQGRDEHHRYHR